MDRTGAAAVEFALTIGIFLTSLLVIVDLSLLYLTSNSLTFALDETARRIMVGDSSVSASRQNFRTAFCNDAFMVTKCDADLLFDVRTIDPSTAMEPALPLDDTGELASDQFLFDTGGANSYILARALIDYRFISPGLGALFDSNGNNSIVLVATTAFRNEPF